MKLVKYVAEGEAVAWGYGFAWRDYIRGGTISYPIPLNMIFANLRRLWHWTLYGKRMPLSVRDKIHMEGFERGKRQEKNFQERIQESKLEEAYNRGCDDGMAKINKRIAESFKDQFGTEL